MATFNKYSPGKLSDSEYLVKGVLNRLVALSEELVAPAGGHVIGKWTTVSSDDFYDFITKERKTPYFSEGI